MASPRGEAVALATDEGDKIPSSHRQRFFLTTTHICKNFSAKPSPSRGKVSPQVTDEGDIFLHLRLPFYIFHRGMKRAFFLCGEETA